MSDPIAVAASLPVTQAAVRMREAAEKLEAAFLSEMLKSAAVGKPPESFGGGIGETQFSSFLRDAQAQEMVKAGGLGLAEHIFEALKRYEDAKS